MPGHETCLIWTSFALSRDLVPCFNPSEARVSCGFGLTLPQACPFETHSRALRATCMRMNRSASSLASGPTASESEFWERDDDAAEEARIAELMRKRGWQRVPTQKERDAQCFKTRAFLAICCIALIAIICACVAIALYDPTEVTNSSSRMDVNMTAVAYDSQLLRARPADILGVPPKGRQRQRANGRHRPMGRGANSHRPPRT